MFKTEIYFNKSATPDEVYSDEVIDEAHDTANRYFHKYTLNRVATVGIPEVYESSDGSVKMVTHFCHKVSILPRRKLLGYTQEELSNLLGVSRAAVCHYDRCLRYPTKTVLLLLATIPTNPNKRRVIKSVATNPLLD